MMQPGLVLFDSVASMRREAKEEVVLLDSEASRDEYVGRKQYESSLLRQYGLKAEVIIQDGLRFAPRARSSPWGTYGAFLQAACDKHPRGAYDFVMLVSCGNDIYGPRAAVTAELYQGLQRAANCAEYLCGSPDKVIIIFGGSSATWRYAGSAGAEYDQRVQQVLGWCLRNLEGIKLLSGATELASIKASEVVDRIGHLKYEDGFKKLVAAVYEWYLIVKGKGPFGQARSKL